MSTKGRIFISHATDDRNLAAELIDLFVAGLAIPSDHIFCSSVEGHTIPTGVEFKPFMREQLAQGVAVVGLISPNYLDNNWCVAELGATWGLVKEFYPLLVPPISYGAMPPFLAGTQSLELDKEGHLDRLCNDLPALFGRVANTAKWNLKKAKFLKALPKILRSLKSTARLSASEAASLKKELSDYKALADELEAEKMRLEAKLHAVSKIKDKKEVSAVLASFAGEEEQFETVIKKAREAINKLSSAAREALFQECRGNDLIWTVDRPVDGIDSAVEAGELEEWHADPPTFRLNPAKPKVRAAVEALEELKEFAQYASPEFRDGYEAKHNDNFDIESRDFWRRSF